MEPPPPTPRRLERLDAGMPLLVGGDRVVTVDAELARAFAPGDALEVLVTGEVLHLPATDRAAAARAVDAAVEAFAAMDAVDDAAVSGFFATFAEMIADDATFAPIAAANADDVALARERGRSTTRLALTARMRADMVAGLRGWADAASGRGTRLRTIEHDGWRLDEVRDRLGVVGFVFEGRPNVFADACGVLRGGNTVVFRIGSDALGTARAIVRHALAPALAAHGLPAGAASLVDAPARASGWALFADPRLALAVARGSGEAVRQLGAIARRAGTPVSLHGTGGAWMLVTRSADPARLAGVVRHSLDRKVCNTLNVCLVERAAAERFVPVVLDALEEAARSRGASARLHVLARDADALPAGWLDREVDVVRAEGTVREARATTIDEGDLAREWEWEESPEMTLGLVDDLDHAIALVNTHSPRFVVSVVSEDPAEHDHAFARLDAPYVGDGFTRWVDGQWALGVPELGLSNWEAGRLLGRGGILAGDAIATVRHRMTQHDPDVHR